MDVRTLLPCGAVVLGLVLAGCGADAGTDADDAPGADEPAATSLEITVWPDGEGSGEPTTYTVTCDPPAGEHPDPEGACAALQELGAGAFAPVPADVMCTQQFGGPQQAHVVGTIDGEAVDARLSLTDGCEISRWEAVSAVVPGAEGSPA